jgi:tetratricopeptide (TPR) repeat protein
MPAAEISDEEMWAELDEAQGPRRAEILLELADRSYHRDDMAQFATLVEAAAEAAEAAEDHRLAAFARFNQAQGLMETDHPADAIDHFLRAAGYFTLLGDQEDVALCHHRAADALALVGRRDEALAHWDDAIRLYEAEDDEHSVGRVKMAIGGLRMSTGSPSLAVDAFREARDRFRRTHAPHHVAWADDAAAEGLIQQGRPDEAVPLLRSCLDIARVGSDDSARAYAALRLGLVLRILGEHTEALAHLKSARDDYRDDDNLMGVARCDLEAANALRALDESEEAEGLYIGARSVFDALGADDYLLLADRMRATLYSEQGRTVEAIGLARATLARAHQAGQNRMVDPLVSLIADDLLDLDDPAAALQVIEAYPVIGGELDEMEGAIRDAVTARALLANDRVADALALTEKALAISEARPNLALQASLYELRSRARRNDEPASADRDLAHAIALFLAAGLSERATSLSEHFLPDEEASSVRREDLFALRGLTRPQLDEPPRTPGAAVE